MIMYGEKFSFWNEVCSSRLRESVLATKCYEGNRQWIIKYIIINRMILRYQATTEDGNNTAALFATLKFKARSNLHFEFKFCVSFC